MLRDPPARRGRHRKQQLCGSSAIRQNPHATPARRWSVRSVRKKEARCTLTAATVPAVKASPASMLLSCARNVRGRAGTRTVSASACWRRSSRTSTVAWETPSGSPLGYAEEMERSGLGDFKVSGGRDLAAGILRHTALRRRPGSIAGPNDQSCANVRSLTPRSPRAGRVLGRPGDRRTDLLRRMAYSTPWSLSVRVAGSASRPPRPAHSAYRTPTRVCR